MVRNPVGLRKQSCTGLYPIKLTDMLPALQLADNANH